MRCNDGMSKRQYYCAFQAQEGPMSSSQVHTRCMAGSALCGSFHVARSNIRGSSPPRGAPYLGLGRLSWSSKLGLLEWSWKGTL